MPRAWMTDLSRLRKRRLEDDAATSAGAADEIDIAGCATIAYSSEDPAHPVEPRDRLRVVKFYDNALDGVRARANPNAWLPSRSVRPRFGEDRQ